MRKSSRMLLVVFLFSVFTQSLFAKVPILSGDLQSLKEVFNHPANCLDCREDFQKWDGAIPEIWTKRGVMLFSYFPDQIEFDLHKQIIDNVKPPYWVVVFTANPAPYQEIQRWENKTNLKVVKVDQFSGKGVWGRDYFPETILKEGKMEWLQFQYYGPEHRLATGWIKEVGEQLSIGYKNCPVNLEGGNILFDDEKNVFISDMMITRNCRSGGIITQDVVVDILKKDLHINDVVIVPALPGDGTGHIDMFAKIVGHRKVIVADSQWEHRHIVLDQVANIFKEKGYEVIRIMNADWGKTLSDVDGRNDLTLTYTNSFILGKTVFLPSYAKVVFDPDRKFEVADVVSCYATDPFDECRVQNWLQENDRLAKKAYEKLGYNVVQIPSGSIILRSGAIHCITKSIY